MISAIIHLYKEEKKKPIWGWLNHPYYIYESTALWIDKLHPNCQEQSLKLLNFRLLIPVRSKEKRGRIWAWTSRSGAPRWLLHRRTLKNSLPLQATGSEMRSWIENLLLFYYFYAILLFYSIFRLIKMRIRGFLSTSYIYRLVTWNYA